VGLLLVFSFHTARKVHASLSQTIISTMKLTVIIPTYRRSADLDLCCRGLAAQRRVPDQVILVLRVGDAESAAVAQRWADLLPVEPCLIDVPGVVQALNLALDAATGDIITITDDDTFALEDWAERIEEHFERDPKLGGLGGRDIIHERGKILPTTAEPVGVILPFGRPVGNHHSGRGPARRVDHLKGVNMSWRRTAIQRRRFDATLHGAGAQPYFELAFSLDLQRHGWHLVYDPAIQVHHFLAQRFDNDVRGNPDLKASEDAAYNLYVSLRRYMPRGLRRQTALLWVYTISGFGHPGVLKGLLYLVTRNKKGLELRAGTARAWRDAKEACAAH
jgi:glycosyltransferase involved in cell wall biosynthesis